MVLLTPTAIPIRLTIIIVIGGIIRDVHFTIYRSANSSSTSSPPDFDVKVKEISIPAITLSKPCSTAARCALVPPINQNCSFLHHSSSSMPDHLISSTASMHKVTVMVKR
ncbi:hypothetical protein V8G54_024315 [Vigna mungo]|uniref:Uncharacterized protein n=1 Tax=Vigna mungo TaxID=3915 RepID=A0AAQ3N5P5_VIGMU